jgi:RNA polymerase sigma-70 factor (ECF subfamily)
VLNRHSADDAIQAALRRNDPAAVELIWDRYARDLLAFLQAIVCSKHDAEDVLGAVFVRIVRKWRKLARAKCLNAYIYGIARNEAASFLRVKQRTRGSAPGGEVWLEPAEPGDERAELAEELQVALGRLPQSQREVVVLKVYRDKTFEEIGEMLGVSLNTAASRYRYAMERLRTLLRDFTL